MNEYEWNTTIQRRQVITKYMADREEPVSTNEMKEALAISHQDMKRDIRILHGGGYVKPMGKRIIKGKERYFWTTVKPYWPNATKR